MLKFVSGNKGKAREMKQLLAPLNMAHVNIDLDEIQEIDVSLIMEHKIKEALKHHTTDFFIEDTCLYLEALKNKLPGPFIKWFWQSLEPLGLYLMAKKLGNTQAKMVSTIAYVKNKKNILFFKGETLGNIVKPKGSYGFGIDPIFQPKGSSKTLSELKQMGDLKFGSRSKAAKKLKKYLIAKN